MNFECLLCGQEFTPGQVEQMILIRGRSHQLYSALYLSSDRKVAHELRRIKGAEVEEESPPAFDSEPSLDDLAA